MQAKAFVSQITQRGKIVTIIMNIQLAPMSIVSILSQDSVSNMYLHQTSSVSPKDRLSQQPQNCLKTIESSNHSYLAILATILSMIIQRDCYLKECLNSLACYRDLCSVREGHRYLTIMIKIRYCVVLICSPSIGKHINSQVFLRCYQETIRCSLSMKE